MKWTHTKTDRCTDHLWINSHTYTQEKEEKNWPNTNERKNREKKNPFIFDGIGWVKRRCDHYGRLYRKGSRIQQKSICMRLFLCEWWCCCCHICERKDYLMCLDERMDINLHVDKMHVFPSNRCEKQYQLNRTKSQAIEWMCLDIIAKRDKSIWWKFFGKNNVRHNATTNARNEKINWENESENWWFLSMPLQYWSRTKRFSSSALWKWTKLMHHTLWHTSSARTQFVIVRGCSTMNQHQMTSTRLAANNRNAIQFDWTGEIELWIIEVAGQTLVSIMNLFKNWVKLWILHRITKIIVLFFFFERTNWTRLKNLTNSKSIPKSFFSVVYWGKLIALYLLQLISTFFHLPQFLFSNFFYLLILLVFFRKYHHWGKSMYFSKTKTTKWHKIGISSFSNQMGIQWFVIIQGIQHKFNKCLQSKKM